MLLYTGIYNSQNGYDICIKVGFWDVDFGMSFDTELKVLQWIYDTISKCFKNDGFIYDD